MNKKIVSMLLVCAMLLTMVFSLAGCAGEDAVAPQLRINSTSNEWEVSYDEGSTWISMGVKATGAAGAAGQNGTNGTNGVDGVNGVDGADGKDGVNGVDGKDGVNGVDGKDGATPTIGEDGYWYINGENTGIYAGKSDKVTVTFKEWGGDVSFEVPVDSKVNYYVPSSPIAVFENWYSDADCTKVFNFNTEITEDTTVYAKWTLDETFVTVANLTKDVSFGNANVLGTSFCFDSVYVRVLTDDHGYYSSNNGPINIIHNGRDCLEEVFVKNEGVVSVNPSSKLKSISYTEGMTVLNFASAMSSFEQYYIRNGLEMPEKYVQQKELAIEYFNTVDTTVENYHKSSRAGFFSFPSMAVSVVAMGSLMEQQDTERFDTLIKDAYENVDAAFWNSAMYLNPFYQLCAKYDWYTGKGMPDMSTKTSLTTADVLSCYGFGIDLANDYADLWNAFVESALSDNVLSSSEAKAFAYHYAYQLTGGDVCLGVYGHSSNIVDYSIAQ